MPKLIKVAKKVQKKVNNKKPNVERVVIDLKGKKDPVR